MRVAESDAERSEAATGRPFRAEAEVSTPVLCGLWVRKVSDGRRILSDDLEKGGLRREA